MFTSSSFDKGAMPVLRRMIQFTEARHVKIANNIANVETPYYQSQDLDAASFHKQLTEAIDQRREGNPRKWQFGSSRNVRLQDNGSVHFRTIDSRDVGIMKHDQNNVDIDKEMVKLAKNTMLHNTAIELLNSQYSVLEVAISERV